MRVLVLSREENYSTRRFREEAGPLDLEIDVVNPHECALGLGRERRQVYWHGGFVEGVGAVVPRGGAESTEYELTVPSSSRRSGCP